MVEMIQRIFRSFEHNNLGALYPPPEGTGFTARVISQTTEDNARLLAQNGAPSEFLFG